MGKILRFTMFCMAALALSACDMGKDSATTDGQQQATSVAVSVPTGTDDKAWREYLMSVAKQNMQGIRNSPYMYYLPSTQDPEFEQKYLRQMENVESVIARTVLPGNMLAFGSPESARMADMVETSFTNWAEPNAFQGVRVLFIGQEADRARVEAAVQPSGAEFVFVEVK